MSLDATLDAIITKIIDAEGRVYTNHANDRGGPTKYGITLATLRAWRKKPDLMPSDVEHMTEDEARRIYFDQYITKPGFHLILSLSRIVGLELIDSGVNCGQQRAAMWLQTALNAFNRSYLSRPDWPELKVDGDIGPATVDAMRTFMQLRGNARGERVLKRALDSQQGAHYLNLGAKSASQEQFMLGWFDNRIG